MLAIFKKELRTFFMTPLAYVVIAIFNCLCAIMFLATTLLANTSDVKNFFGSLIIVIIMVISILSMRFFSEEKRTKTDQLLLTSPVSLTGIVIGKFLAGLVVYLCALLLSLIFMIVMAFLGKPEGGVIFGNYLGLILVGMALLAIGVLISSLTQSQIVASVVTFVTFLLMLLSTSLLSMVKQMVVGLNATVEKIITSIAEAFAIYEKYNQFASGVLDISAIIYYVSVTAIFLFLTVRVLEKRRWS